MEKGGFFRPPPTSQLLEAMSLSSSSVSARHEASTVDELSMQQSLLFSDSLKDLKNLRSQLYSAADYFELSYNNNDQKQIVVNTLKDYAVKALVNTVDHLGSVSYKVNGLLDEKVGEVSGTELRVSCIEQRIRTCQEYIDREGLSQQSLVITAPKYHKRYILPVGASIPISGNLAVAKNKDWKLHKEESGSQEFQSVVRPTIRERASSRGKTSLRSPPRRARSTSPSRKARSTSPAPQSVKFPNRDKRAASPLPSSNLFPRTGKFSAADKRAVSPLPRSSPLARSGSLSSRPNVLNSSSVRRRYPNEAQKSASMRLHAERDDDKEMGLQIQSKSRSFLKSLLSKRRSRKDEMLYTYLDEY